MKTDISVFIRATGLKEEHAGIIESQMGAIIRHNDRADYAMVDRLLAEGMAMWKKMGDGGRVVIGEVASVLATVGMVDRSEQMVLGSGIEPRRIHALLAMTQGVIKTSFYSHDPISLAEMLTQAGNQERLGDGGRAALLDRLVSSPVQWPLGIDDDIGNKKVRVGNSCARVLEVYWSRIGENKWNKKPVDQASMEEALEFAKALAKHGSDPLGGSLSALATAIPPRAAMDKDPNMWMLEQVWDLGWNNEQAREQAWSVAIREDVARVYRKNQQLGDRAKTLERLGIEFDRLSTRCNRWLSLKMAALDSSCVPILKQIKAKGLDVEWGGPCGTETFFSAYSRQSKDTMARALQAASGLSIPFTEADLVLQCTSVNTASVKFMLKQDPAILQRLEDDHPLSRIAAYADNKKNNENINEMTDIFVQNAREQNRPIEVNSRMLNVLMRSGAIEKIMENPEWFSFDPALSKELLNKLCNHPTLWNARLGKTLGHLVDHILEVGIELPAGKKRQAGLVARAMQSRNPLLATALLDRGVCVKDMTIDQFLPKHPHKTDPDQPESIGRVLRALARGGVVMSNISDEHWAWINPMIAAAQQEWMEENVDRPVHGARETSASRPRF